MKIYKYNPNCKEWENIRNSKLVGIERENAFNECVKNIGVELTLQEYFAIYPRKSDFTKGVCYRCIDKPTNILERLAYSEMESDDDLLYIDMKKSFHIVNQWKVGNIELLYPTNDWKMVYLVKILHLIKTL